MHIEQKEAASILTPQRQGFLASGPYPFTHALSGYLGCAFGQTTCGLYCYAQFLPNWQFRNASYAWGEAVTVKSNAPELLEKTLSRMKSLVTPAVICSSSVSCWWVSSGIGACRN